MKDVKSERDKNIEIYGGKKTKELNIGLDIPDIKYLRSKEKERESISGQEWRDEMMERQREMDKIFL